MTEKVQKVKPQEFVSEFEKLLLDDNTHNILVRGYFYNTDIVFDLGAGQLW